MLQKVSDNFRVSDGFFLLATLSVTGLNESVWSQIYSLEGKMYGNKWVKKLKLKVSYIKWTVFE